MIEHMPPEALTNYMKQVFIVLFQRLTSSKTTKYVKSLLVFFFVFTIKNGGSALISMVDSIQAGMFGMVCDSLIVKDGTVQKISGSTEKKISAVGLIKLMTETPEIVSTNGKYSNQFLPLLTTLIALFELPEDETIPDDEHFIEIEDTPGYQTAYSQLIFAGKPEHDPVAGVGDPKAFLAASLAALPARRPSCRGSSGGSSSSPRCSSSSTSSRPESPCSEAPPPDHLLRTYQTSEHSTISKL